MRRLAYVAAGMLLAMSMAGAAARADTPGVTATEIRIGVRGLGDLGGGNGDCDIEKVIQKQRRGGNQTGDLSEILLGYCVRTAAVRIGGQRLAIRKMQNRQQNENCDDNFADVGKPDNPEGREYSKRRFRTIGGRAKRIQTKNRNAAERADPLLFSFGSFQRSAENDSENR